MYMYIVYTCIHADARVLLRVFSSAVYYMYMDIIQCIHVLYI